MKFPTINSKKIARTPTFLLHFVAENVFIAKNKIRIKKSKKLLFERNFEKQIAESIKT